MKQNELNSAVYEALCRIAEKNLDHVADVVPQGNEAVFTLENISEVIK